MKPLHGDIKIVRVELGEGGITKVPNWYAAGNLYRWNVIYVLADGRRVTGKQSRRLLREAKAEVATLPKNVNTLAAMFDTDGRFYGTSQLLLGATYD